MKLIKNNSNEKESTPFHAPPLLHAKMLTVPDHSKPFIFVYAHTEKMYVYLLKHTVSF